MSVFRLVIDANVDQDTLGRTVIEVSLAIQLMFVVPDSQKIVSQCTCRFMITIYLCQNE